MSAGTAPRGVGAWRWARGTARGGAVPATAPHLGGPPLPRPVSDGHVNHDQNFKNLILDYSREALAFFAEGEAADLPPEVRITPLRQEQLQERLGERFRELDIPLLVEWPDGQRAALLFVVEDADRLRPGLPGVLHPPRPAT